MAKAIKVYARIRPADIDCVQCLYEITNKRLNSEVKEVLSFYNKPCRKRGTSFNFLFQKVFDQCASQSDLFNCVATPIVKGVLNGQNGALFAYGQTGTGKTHTIVGGINSPGVIFRAFALMFALLENEKIRKETTISISALEIYNEVCYDLLSGDLDNRQLNQVFLFEDTKGSINLRNLGEHDVGGMDEVESLVQKAMSNRIVGSTTMNPASSRSHCVVTMYIRHKKSKSKLHMVDLSGSEQLGKNRLTERHLYEAKHINLSLHYLEQVILALSDHRRTHVPYRNSAITSLLRDSLGGGAMTAMVFTISLESSNFSETLHTCRFAQRVTLVKTNLQRSMENPKTKNELNFLKSEVNRLQKLVTKMKAGMGRPQAAKSSFESLSRSKFKDLQNVESKWLVANFNITVKHINKGIHMLSTLLQATLPILDMKDEEKIKLFDVSKLSNAFGLTLPDTNPFSGEVYTEEEKIAFDKFLSLSEPHKSLISYGEMNIDYFNHLETEWKVWKKINKLMLFIERVQNDIHKASSEGEFPDVVEKLHRDCKRSRGKIDVLKNKLDELCTKRYNSLKYFSQAKHSLLECFWKWFQNRNLETQKVQIGNNEHDKHGIIARFFSKNEGDTQSHSRNFFTDTAYDGSSLVPPPPKQDTVSGSRGSGGVSSFRQAESYVSQDGNHMTMIREISREKVPAITKNINGVDVKLTGNSEIDSEILKFYANRQYS